MLFDIHCHVNLYLVLEEILNDAQVCGVQKVIGVAMSAMSQERILEISTKHPQIYPALGIHPQEVEENPMIRSQLPSIIELIAKNKDQLCAIGEIGLDHHFVKNEELYPLQKDIFEEMLTLAQKFQLPVNLHTKGAEQQVFDTLPSYNIPSVNIHWYSGPEHLLKQGIDRGYFFSITPALSYSPAVKKTVEMVNLDHFLLESDGPVEYRGKAGTPAMIKEVLKSIAKLKNLSESDLEAQIEENTRKIFPKLF